MKKQTLKPHMKRTLLATFGILVFQLNAQQASKMSLKEAVAYAEKNSPTLQNAQTDVTIAETTVKNIKSIGLPQVNASASFQQYLQIPGSWIKNFNSSPGSPEYIFLKFQQQFYASGSIGVNQLLFDGSFFLGLKAAKEYVNMSQLLVAKSKVDLQSNVAKAYLLALTTRKNIDLLESNLKTLEKSYKDVQGLNKEGFAESLDVQRLELAVSNLNIQKEKLQNAASVTVNLLKFQIGMPMDSTLILTDDLETLDKSMSSAETAGNNFDIKNRNETKIFEQAFSLSKMDEKRYKLGYYPTLVGFLTHQVTTNRSQFNFFESNLTPNNNFVPATLYGLSLNIPVFDGFRKQTQMQDVRLKRMKTENEFRMFENAANMEYTNAKLSYEINLKQVEAQKKNLDLAKDIYNKTNIKFREGVGSSLEIMQADTDLKTAQINYLNALYDLVISKMDLKKAKGEEILN